MNEGYILIFVYLKEEANITYALLFLLGLEKYLPIGMESFQISNVQLSASSEMNMSYSATHARLNLNFDGGAWVPAKSDPTEYLQIDLTWITILSGIMTQGHPENSHRLLSYTLQYGISSEDFTMYNKVL